MVEKKDLARSGKGLACNSATERLRIAGNPGSRNGLRIDEVTAAACAA